MARVDAGDGVDGADRCAGRRPAVVVVALAALGLWIGRDGPDWSPAVGLGVAAVCAGMGLVLRGWWWRVAMALGVVALSQGYLRWRVMDAPADDLRWWLRETPALVCVQGTVLDAPVEGRAQRGAMAGFSWSRGDVVTRTRIDVERAQGEDGGWRAASGALWVRIGGRVEGVRAGDVVRVWGMARGVSGPGNPGERDLRLTAWQRGISGSVSIDDPALVEVVRGERTVLQRARSGVLRGIDGLRAHARHWLEGDEGRGDAQSRALIAALLLGQYDGAVEGVRGAFYRLGLAHVLTVSGFHLAMFVWFLLLALRLSGERPRLEWMILASSVVVYLLLVPAQAPIIRAGLVVLAWVAAESLGRRYDRLNTLAWVMVAVLVWRPMELWDIGFQLSFASVAVLIAVAGPLRVRALGPRLRLEELGWRRWALDRTGEAALASLAAWGVTAPLVAHHLGVVSPMAVVSTLVTLPLASALIGVGYFGLVVMTIVPASAEVIQPVLHAASMALAAMVLWLDRLPGTVVYVRGPGVSVAWTVAAMMVLAWWMRVGSWREWRGVAATVIVVAWGAASLTALPLARDVVFRMDTLAVGDGTCHILRSGREAMLIDCGSTWYGVGERDVPRALVALGVPATRRVIVSHSDIDHYSGLLDAARPAGVRRVLVTEELLRQAERPGSPEEMLVVELGRLGVEVGAVSAGEVIRLGEVMIEVLHPAAGARFERDNDGSIVVLVRVPTGAGERRVLLCGDIEGPGIAALESAHGALRAEVMEAPHHGSANPQAIEFVGRVDPLVVVQSTGPSRVGDARWSRVRGGRTWLSTAEVGAVWVEVRRDGEVGRRP